MPLRVWAGGFTCNLPLSFCCFLWRQRGIEEGRGLPSQRCPEVLLSDHVLQLQRCPRSLLGAVKAAQTWLLVVLALHRSSSVPDRFASWILWEEDFLPNCLKTCKHTFAC